MLITFYSFLMLCVCANKRGVPWFLYHHIGDEGVPAEWFEEHLQFIKTLKMNTLTNRDVAKYLDTRGRVPKNSILITFDDGYYDNYSVAYPLLKRYDMKATLYLNTAYVEDDVEKRAHRYLSWSEIREMSDSGHFDIQLHSHRHMPIFVDTQLERVVEERDLSDREIQYLYGGQARVGYPIFRKRGEYSSRGIHIPLQCADRFKEKYKTLKGTDGEKIKEAQKFIDDVLLKEFISEDKNASHRRIQEDLDKNIRFVQDHCGYTPSFFCWPWGHRSKEFIDLLKAEGITGFVTTKKGTNSRRHNLNNIKRVELRSFTPNKFKLNLLICRNLILGKIYQLFS